MTSTNLTYEDLKKYLKITWNNEDEEIKAIYERGKSYLNAKAGVEIDFNKDANAYQLLLDYGRYVYNHSFEMFEINFSSLLNALIFEKGAEDHANKETSS